MTVSNWYPMESDFAKSIDSRDKEKKIEDSSLLKQPCSKVLRYVSLKIQFKGAADYILGDNIYLRINASGFRKTYLYDGFFQPQIAIDNIPYCPDELNDQSDHDYRSWSNINIVLYDLSTNSYMAMPSESSYPLVIWKDVVIELYPWGEVTLEKDILNGHHMYPQNQDLVVPKKFKRHLGISSFSIKNKI